MKRIAILSSVLALGVLTALTSGHFLAPKPAPTRIVRAQWKNIYRTTAGLVAGADLIVIANHMYAEPGRSVGEGEDATPFTNNAFAINSILKGENDGPTLVLEQTGGIMGNGAVLNIDDGGPYEPGATYLLFLKSTGEGSYYLINHQARYRVTDGVLEGVDPTDEVVARMHGLSLDRSVNIIEKRVRMLE